MFRRILIANRGEIACRIARTCRRLGIAVSTIHSEADRGSLHVREIGDSVEIGPPPATLSYLAIDRIVAAAQRVGADAVHPGYGFLAENALFASALQDAGITFIGPSPDVLSRFGDKAAAKREARSAGVPVVPGTLLPTDVVDEVLAAVAEMTFPVLLKAAAGGGGKGMRVVTSTASLRSDIEGAMREGRGAFGDARLIAEEYLPEARHIEVQILGDGQGGVVHLLDRECSLQRRHQKVMEEAPVLSLAPELRAEILDHAVRLGAAVAYRGLGTVEFIVKGERAYFLEVNPRIQVEHPVTEEVTGFDLVELQIRAVADGQLPVKQADVRARGVSVEARLYAEDPDDRFLPSTGVVEALSFPKGLRVDAGVDVGMSITPYYDPMIAKLIAWGEDRAGAYARLEAALSQTCVQGVVSNVGFLRRLCADPKVRANDIHTGTVDETSDRGGPVEAAPLEDVAIAAALWLREKRSLDGGVWSDWSGLTGWRLGGIASSITASPTLRLRSGGVTHDVSFGAVLVSGALPVGIGGETWDVQIQSASFGQALVSIGGRSRTVTPVVAYDHAGFSHEVRSVRLVAEAYLSGTLLSPEVGGDGRVRAPMMGRVIAVDVHLGQAVAEGERLAVMESMKMELALTASCGGTVAEVGCEADTTVERDQIMFVILAPMDAAA